MTRKVKPCVTIPYWKILQDREGEKLEEEKESAKQAPQQETLLEVIGQGGGGRRAEPKAAEPKAEAREEEKPGGSEQADAEDTLISESFSGTGQPGPRWTRHSSAGWWWHQASGLIYSEAERKYFVWEELLQQHIEADPFHAPSEESGLSFRAEASSAGSGATPSAKSVIIRDLVAVGQALRTPLQHLDRPAALFAVFQGGPGSDSAEFYAKSLHAKLLRLLSQYRGFWSAALVRGALQAAFEQLDGEARAKQGEKARGQPCSCTAALLLGSRLFIATLGDSQTALFRARGEGAALERVALAEVTPEPRGASHGTAAHGAAVHGAVASAWAGIVSSLGERGSASRASSGQAVVGRAARAAQTADATHATGGDGASRACRVVSCQLHAQQFPQHCLVLCAGGEQGVGAGAGGSAFEHASVRPLLLQRRPRALAGAMASRLSLPVDRSAGQKAGAVDRSAGQKAGAVGAATAQGRAAPAIALAVDFKSLRLAEDEEERPAKRPRQAEAAAPSRIRCRHILLKHRELKQPTDTVRRKRVERSREEAEERLRGLLAELLADAGRFPQLARKHSECSSCLKGGEQAGDLGWITRGVRGAGGVSKEVEEAAFVLAVGELSDLVLSEAGVHLLQRIA